MTAKTFYTLRELAKIMRVSRWTLRRMMKGGHLPCHRFGGAGNRQGAIRFSAEDVNYIIRVNHVAAKAVPSREIKSKDLCYICRKRYARLLDCPECGRQVCAGDMGEGRACLACVEKSVLGD